MATVTMLPSRTITNMLDAITPSATQRDRVAGAAGVAGAVGGGGVDAMRPLLSSFRQQEGP
ncbi:hypothetical protein GCM10022245_52450 [Streptomyces mayteni]